MKNTFLWANLTSEVHNISNNLDAWLTFLSSDKSEDIVSLINSYPEFMELYQEIAALRTKPKELISMYSEALAIADKNTVKLMIDDMKDAVIMEKDAAIMEKDVAIMEKDAENKALRKQIEELQAQLVTSNAH